MEMGDGRIHFRFQNEEDLETILANRTYHYDGSMIALERWVPTVRRDFPNTIPFWIVINGLPDYRRDEEPVTSIGEAIGEWMDVDVTEPTPRVRVLLDCNSPLVVRRDSDDDGVLVRLDFRYEKLQKPCTRCMRITHEAPLCPDRPREQRREPLRGKEAVEVKGRRMTHIEDRGMAETRPRRSRERTGQAAETTASSSRRKLVRRDILAELESSDAKGSTKDWRGTRGNHRRIMWQRKPSHRELSVIVTPKRRLVSPIISITKAKDGRRWTLLRRGRSYREDRRRATEERWRLGFWIRLRGSVR